MGLLQCKHSERHHPLPALTKMEARKDERLFWASAVGATLITFTLISIVAFTSSLGLSGQDVVHLVVGGSWNGNYKTLVQQRINRLRDDEAADQTCPLPYRRLTGKELHRRKSFPYLLGGQRQPECTTCGEENWQQFCEARDSGPICPYKEVLVDILMNAGHHEYLMSSPCDLWHHVHGRSVFVMGDSQTLDFYKALVCTLREFLDLENTLPTPPDRLKHAMFGLGGPVSNNSTLADWFYFNRPGNLVPSCVHFINSTRVCYLRYDTIQQADGQLEQLEQLMQPRDLKVINFGLHHNARDLTTLLPPFLSRMRASHSLGSNLYFRDTPPQHFDTPNGGWTAGTKPPYDCKPLQGVQLRADGALRFRGGKHGKYTSKEAYLAGNQRNIHSNAIAQDFGVPVVHTYNQTLMLWAFHRDSGAGMECTHFCWPVPGLWVHALIKTLRQTPLQGH